MKHLALQASLAALIAAFAAPTYAAQQVTVDNNVPVTVTNPDTNPVKTRDVENPARHHFALTTTRTFEFWDVPSGKLYVIEQYSARCNVDATGSLSDVSIRINHVVADYAVPHYVDANGGSAGGPVNIWEASGHTRLYAEPGATILLATESNTNATGAIVRSCVGNVSGYSVDVP